MALGKQIGQFSLKPTSYTITPGPGGTPTIQGNFEGSVSGEEGEGTATGTLTVAYEPNMKSGTWSYCGLTAFNKGGGNVVNSQGTWEETGPNKWRYRGTGQQSDGRTYATEFDGDFATRTWAGKIYEWS